jgi:branched-chain amino acid aminotransferase
MNEDEDVRAVRGGTGEAKCGGNYGAPSARATALSRRGYSQVLCSTAWSASTSKRSAP